jgi:hypothetical protein
MKSTLQAQQKPAAGDAAGKPKTSHRWLLFVHQLPSKPSNLRVRTWRRLQQLGAIPVKQAVYVLPDTPNTREDFEWLKTEIKGSGGDASVFAADSVDSWSDDALAEEFRRVRQDAYAGLAREIERVLRRVSTTRRPRGTRAPAARRLLEMFRKRLTAIEQVDFFGSAGRDRVVKLLDELEEKARDPGRPAIDTGSTHDVTGQHYSGRLWVTRPRPGVDRMASAWLIGRFIDPDARFDVVADREAAPQDSVPFDMFGVEFTHRGDLCTFEMLCETFRLQEPALMRLGAIVHDLDLKDGRFGATEAPAIGLVIEGLRLVRRDDQELLTDGRLLFEALYQSFIQATLASGPRPVAKPRMKGLRRKTQSN